MANQVILEYSRECRQIKTGMYPDPVVLEISEEPFVRVDVIGNIRVCRGCQQCFFKHEMPGELSQDAFQPVFNISAGIVDDFIDAVEQATVLLVNHRDAHGIFGSPNESE